MPAWSYNEYDRHEHGGTAPLFPGRLLRADSRPKAKRIELNLHKAYTVVNMKADIITGSL
jgi:hypothetical protein